MSKSSDASSYQRELKSYINREYAQFRKQQISDVAYNFEVDISSRDHFSGVATIDFNLADSLSPVTLDFDEGTLLRVEVNGQPITTDYEKWFITIAAEHLSKGHNTIVIAYQRNYTNTGAGLYQFRDPETDKVYLYTQFEPYEANKFAPLFDQPDIKATFTMNVIAPLDWQVISATRESQITPISTTTKRWQFPTTKLIPSYIFSLHAGPFRIWEDNSGTIPLRLFARQEVAEFIEANIWFDITHKAFSFFNEYYSFPYPFEKYDQLLVPNFNFGAMENVGAITFSENRFISRGEKTKAENFYLAEVIAHEMAHQWFGDIVTMDWWNGLWLNESFATLMAFLAVEANPDFDDVWNEFLKLKNWAYYEDQLVTTHPIDVPVAHPGEVFSLIDGISYGKGASVLQQLRYLLGEKTFQNAVATYIEKHQYNNAQLSDFVAAMSQTANTDMTGWAHEWLKIPGVNTIEPQFNCSEGKLQTIKIIQYAPEAWQQLRTQKVQLALFNRSKSEMKLSSVIPVIYRGELTPVSIAANTPCPDFIYANFQNWGYVKLRFDERSLQSLQQSITEFKDDQLRASLWQDLWRMVDDMQFSLHDYVALVDSHISAETNETTLSSITFLLALAFDELEAMQKNTIFTETLNSIENLSWREFEHAPVTSSIRKLWFRAAISASFNPSRLTELANMLSANQGDELLQDQETRWLIIQQLSRYQFGDATKLIQHELVRDSSERGREAALIANAIRPEMAVKQQWMTALLDNSESLKLSDLTAVWKRLFPGIQQNMLQANGAEILSALPEISRSRQGIFINKLADYVVPSACNTQNAASLQKLLDNPKGIDTRFIKAIKINLQTTQRCLAKSQLMLTSASE